MFDDEYRPWIKKSWEKDICLLTKPISEHRKWCGTSGAIEVEPTVGTELIRRGFWGERRRALSLGKRFYKCAMRWKSE